jgi:hypothetical protein
MADTFFEAASEDPTIWRVLEAGGYAAYTATRPAELIEEFAAKPEEEQRLRLERAFAEMYAAVNEERADDVRVALSVCWVMVRGRRLARTRDLVADFAIAARAEGIAESAAVSDFASELEGRLDELASALEDEEASGALLPDDTVYRTFTLNEKLTSLAERHLRQRGTVNVLPLLGLLRDTLLSLSQKTASGRPLPHLDLEPTDAEEPTQQP